MANIKTILDSVEVRYGCVRFPSRYAAHSVMKVMEEVYYFTRLDYRILSMKNNVWYVVYLTRSGTLFGADDLLCIKERLSMKNDLGV